MYEIILYKDKNGYSEVEEYIHFLKEKANKSKDSRIKFNKIIAYIRMLQKNGVALGEPYIKHIDKDIWELRPLKDRILFAYCDNNKFIFLHIFIKQTQKMPRRELEIAKLNLKDFRKRSEESGK